MHKRRLVSLLTLGAALGLWLLLHGVFWRERRDALAQLDRQHRLLVSLARAELEELVQARLVDAWSRIQAHWRNPLVPLAGAFYQKEGQVVLPRVPRAVPAPPAIDCEATDPLSRAHCAKQSVEKVVEVLMRYAGPPAQELEAQLALLPRLSPVLRRGALRTGLRVGDATLEGLQLRLLRETAAFDAPSFARLGRALVAASEANGVVHDDFELALEAVPRVSPVALDEPSLFARGIGALRPDGAVYGEALAPQVLMRALEDSLRSRGALEVDERVWLPSLSAPQPLRALPLRLQQPRMTRIRQEIAWYFAAKVALTWVAFALVAWWALRQWRAVRREGEELAVRARWLAAVAHELRTPLASMRLLADTLARRLSGDARVRDYPQRLSGDLDQAQALVENMLAFERVRSGLAELQRECLDVSALLRELARDFEPERLQLVVAEGIEVDADPVALRLVLGNLLRNSVLYASQFPSTVTLEALAPGLLLLSDDGPGIAAEERAQLFEPYVRGTRGQQARGSGIGLALCAELMRLHGGAISIEDGTRGGAAFKLRFPPPEMPRKMG